MKILIIVFLVVIFFMFPKFRCIVFHPILTIEYCIKDIYKYLRYCRWREYRQYGTLTIYTGLFGHGKTLMLTKIARKIYKKYNNKKVYDFKDNKWKVQRIHIVSNVKLNDVEYIHLNALDDMLVYADDRFNDGVSVWIFMVDEMSTQINSRSYKENFTTELLNILLTCRHYRFQILGTAQRFNHVDALVRQVTSTADECNKLWRLVTVSVFDAWTVENTADITKIKPRRTKCYFIEDSDFLAYDTTAVVENFKDNVKRGNILTDREVLETLSVCQNEYSKLYLKKKFKKKL